MIKQIYIDMDGVLAKWDTTSTKEDTFRSGYFLKREPETSVLNLLKIMQDADIDVTVLSAAYLTTDARHEKEVWLRHHGIKVPAIYVPYGFDKNEFIPDTGEQMILIDDFSDNLHAWEKASPRHHGIKFMNGINGSNGTWSGKKITPDMSPMEMLEVVLG